tara:strand:- start:1 stop:1077 length:1077 start_codon:yes stop_codon:yes gene_type:complete
MPIAESEVLADTLSLSVSVEGKPIPITSLQYKAAFNTARKIRFTVVGDEFVQLCRLGSKVEVQAGRDRAISNLHFIGIIRETNPVDIGAEIIAMDYITLLATSPLVEYKDENIIGRDLFVLAAEAMNITEIDTTDLLGGSGIRATTDMGLSGIQTRKKFIDKCFENMYKLVEDSTSYQNKLNVVNYYYAIHMSNKIDIMKVDETNVHTKPSLKVSKTNNTIENLSGKLDTTNLVNTYTIISNQNSEISYTHEDADSISRYGVRSETTSSDVTDYPLLVETTRKFVDRNKDPSFNFSFTIRNADHLTLGDLVEVSHPLITKGIKLPISEYSISTNNGLIANIVLGKKRLTLTETIAKIK